MSGRAHPDGICTCASHSARPWTRPEHWMAAEVVYLEARFGRVADATIARRLGRPVGGVLLKAKRLGLRKRDVGWSARQVAEALGVDEGLVSKRWIRRGLLRAQRAQIGNGGDRMYLVAERDVLAFIAEQGQWIDPERVPAWSPFRAAALAQRWVSLTEIAARTGHGKAWLMAHIRSHGQRTGRRGTHWYVWADDAARIPALSPDAVADSRWRRDSVLAYRRARRKGIAA